MADEDQPWFHRSLSRTQAEALLHTGSGEDGCFFIRDRNKHPGDYVMCILFKNKPTHHLMQKNEQGFWLINKRKYGECRTLTEVVELLSKPYKGWPVQLKDYIPNTAAADAVKAAPEEPTQAKDTHQNGANAVKDDATPQSQNTASSTVSPSAEPQAHEAVPTQAQQGQGQPPPSYHGHPEQYNGLASGQAGQQQTPSPAPAQAEQQEGRFEVDHLSCFHGKMDRKVAEAAIRKYAQDQGLPTINNVWLLRQRSYTDYAITIGFANKVTHHLIKEKDGTLTINATVTKATNIDELLEILRGKPKFWPADLTHPVPRPAAAATAAPEAVEELKENEKKRQQGNQELNGEQKEALAQPQTRQEGLREQPASEAPQQQPINGVTSGVTETGAAPPSQTAPAHHHLHQQHQQRPQPQQHHQRPQPQQQQQQQQQQQSNQAATPSFVGIAPEPQVDEVPHPGLPEDPHMLRAMMDETPKLPISLHRKDVSIPLGFGVNSCCPPCVTKSVVDGLAYRAGLRRGDLVVRINNLDTTSVEYQYVLEELRNAGTDVHMLAIRPDMMLKGAIRPSGRVRRSVGQHSSAARSPYQHHESDDDMEGYCSDE